VAAEAHQTFDRLAGLRRIGIDELAYKAATGTSPAWSIMIRGAVGVGGARPGQGHRGPVLRRIGPPDHCAQITHVSTDGAEWITDVVDERCPNAVRGADPYHVVAWGTEALDQVRRDVWNTARGGRGGRATEASKALKNARRALWRNPHDLTEAQQAKLDWIERIHPRLHRAWALKGGPALGVLPVPARFSTLGADRSGPMAGLGAAQPHPRLRGPGPPGSQALGRDRGQH
jgi:hypothetical protein